MFGEEIQDNQLNDKGDFVRTENAMKKIGMSKDKRLDVYKVVAAVLHIGNIEIGESDSGGAEVTAKGMPSVNTSADLLGLDPTTLIEAITTRATKIPGEATLVKKSLSCRNAEHARDALAKALYARLFDYVCEVINQSIPAGGEYFIGILDIAGFEYFEQNSFEQFCINYCNEKLQQFFNSRTLKDEMALYTKEGLNVKSVNYIDNQDMIELIECSKVGIIDVLDEEMKLPRPLDSHFAEVLHQNHKNNFRFAAPRTSKITKYKALRNSEAFILRHFAGAVCYSTTGFVDKNMDALHDSLVTLCVAGKHPLLPKMFKKDSKQTGRGKLQQKSNGSTFRANLNILMEKLYSTGSSFIRCIKPNQEMKANLFDGASIMSQLQSAGIPSVLELMQAGYPSRTKFSDLYGMYKAEMPPKLKKLDSRLFCRALFRALGVDSTDFTYGVSKVFFKPGKFAAFDQMMQGDPETLKALIKKVEKWLIRARWRHAIFAVWMVVKLKRKLSWRREKISTIQAYWRGAIVRNRMKHILDAYRQINQVQSRSGELLDVCKKIPNGKAKQTMQKEVGAYIKLVNALQSDVKSITKVKDALKLKKLGEVMSQLGKIKDQEKELMNKVVSLNKEEQVRIKKMEEERKRKEEEDLHRKLVCLTFIQSNNPQIMPKNFLLTVNLTTVNSFFSIILFLQHQIVTNVKKHSN